MQELSPLRAETAKQIAARRACLGPPQTGGWGSRSPSTSLRAGSPLCRRWRSGSGRG